MAQAKPSTFRVKRGTILAVDDEERAQRLLRLNLEPLGYRVLTAGDAATALELIADKAPDLIMLDLQLPDADGFELCQQIHQDWSIPLIVVSVLRQPADKVRALQLGADDFVTKPFNLGELGARISAVLRRAEGEVLPPQAHFSNGALTIDFGQQQVWVEEQAVELSETEYRLLEALAHHVGRTLVVDALPAKVWGPHYMGGDAQVHLNISRLRRKLGDSARQPRFIVTRPGFGYTMPVERE